MANRQIFASRLSTEIKAVFVALKKVDIDLMIFMLYNKSNYGGYMIQLLPNPKSLVANSNIIAFKKIDIMGNISDYCKTELIDFVTNCSNYAIGTDDFVINFEKTDTKHSEEWYSVVVKDKKMDITFMSDVGAYRALQTVKQLLSQQLFECTIDDEPQNDFRSFMLDVGRYFYPVEHVKKIIDYISLFKFNYFHFHLTEDQGWRFESKKYPKLTEIGSKRSHTNFGVKKEEGYYTQEQLKEIVDYCHKKFIKVIPEIDIPGHTMSALACYPELSCFDRKLKVATHWGVKFDIMCAGKDFTYKFCKDIIDELCEIFTDEYIHIGGDEAPKKRWELCENCNAKMKQVGAKNMTELQVYFANQMAEYAKSKGKKVIMWNIESDENANIKLDKDIIVQYWGRRNDKEFCKVVNSGRKVITSNSSAYYIDLPYGRISLSDSYNTQGVTNIADYSKLYGYETCLWTEYVKDLKKAKFNTFPRLFAISEIFWSGEDKRDYDKFLPKVEQFGRGYIAKFGVKMPSKGVYNPNKIRSFFSKLWFEKRQLVWQGIYLNVDNFLLKHKVIKARKK